jgi:hypothetical protein
VITFFAAARLSLAVCALAPLFGQSTVKKPVTLEDVLKQPFPRSITPVWAPGG